MPYVFAFDHPHQEAPRQLAWLLGKKGADLAEMTSVLGLPVPEGFTVTTEACGLVRERGHTTPELEAEVGSHLRRLSELVTPGSSVQPLLLSVRPGAALNMPGVLRSVLNVGLNSETVEGLAESTGDERFAYDSYRRLIEMYGTAVMGVPQELFTNRLTGAKLLAGVGDNAAVPTDVSKLVIERYLAIIESVAGQPFPQDLASQLRGAVVATFRSWDVPSARNYRIRERIPHHLGIAVSVQQMVFGNRDDRSGTGLAFSRNPSTGERGLHGEFLVGGQGDDVGSTRPTRSLDFVRTEFPAVYEGLQEAFSKLEREYGDAMSAEFTIERDILWLLEAAVADRSGAAAVRIAVALTGEDDLGLTEEQAILRVTGDHLDQLLHPQLSGEARAAMATGLGASPGAAVGQVYFSADDALSAYDEGQDVILVKDETAPEDVHGMAIAEGILTSRGGLASHAAVVARGLGTPAVCGAGAISIGSDHFCVGEIVVNQGDVISLDGATGEVFAGAVDLSEAEVPPEMDQVLGWADRIRHNKMGVRANADTPEDAKRARQFGAEGIGLCRTEHQFLGDRLPIVQRMILAGTGDEEAAALEVLGEVQRADFVQLLEAMDGLPVTVRLLDPPLHEFLPNIEELAIASATGNLDDAGRSLLAAARSHHETNPMLGTRGVRLGILKEDLFRMQARSLVQAALDRKAAGGNPVVEVMVPLIINRLELELVRGWIEEEIDSVLASAEDRPEISIGTMIETPRAALCAGVIASAADFFSFGTNDLTQMTLGFSRDDVERRIMKEYLDRGLLGENPFETIDRLGVGALVRSAAADAKAAKPDLKLGICGEHGGDPASIELFWDAGLDYVSCSPYRVPIARLAVAQAIVRDRTANKVNGETPSVSGGG